MDLPVAAGVPNPFFLQMAGTAAAVRGASLFTRRYLRNVRVAGRLVRPETSRARSVIVYLPGPRKR